MQRTNRIKWKYAWVLLAALALGACTSSDSIRYYMLSADAAPEANSRSSLVLGVGPVTIPDYLDRTELVFQSAPNRFEIPSQHRWAGSLREDVQRVFGANLARQLGTTTVHYHPWDRRLQCDVTVSLSIIRFHSVTGGEAILEANWQIQRNGDNGDNDAESTLQGHLMKEVPLEGDGYEVVVAAQSRLLAEAAKDLAGKVRGMQ
ncbi:MAG: membrane integrity-associated transporter subunit PqiC [Verrucomicrobiae bacterium]|nr:membrane integrity-associated transporter subunit PqiC [Verrucomicrobiae bacterium]